jgi:hypothetical protein
MWKKYYEKVDESMENFKSYSNKKIKKVIEIVFK